MILDRTARRAGKGSPRSSPASPSMRPTMRLAVVLELVGCFCALVLAVTLYAITRDAGPGPGAPGHDLPRRRGRDRCGLPADDAGKALARDGRRSRCARPRGRRRARRVPAEAAELGASPSPRSSLPSAARSSPVCCLRGRIVPVALAWLGVLASILVAGPPSPAARRDHSRRRQRAHVAPDARLRGVVRPVADRQGRRRCRSGAPPGRRPCASSTGGFSFRCG